MRVQVISGPLRDQIGLLGALRPHERVLVLLQLLGGERPVESRAGRDRGVVKTPSLPWAAVVAWRSGLHQVQPVANAVLWGAEKAGVTGQMWLGIISSATMLFLAAPAFADACLFQPRRLFQLSSDTVEWSMLIASGRTCTQGLRFGSINITSVKLIAPPQSGKVDIKGPSFSYAAKADFQGQDQFTIQVSGTVVRIAGVSDVKVTVSVVDK
jgi:hypothetical protein